MAVVAAAAASVQGLSGVLYDVQGFLSNPVAVELLKLPLDVTPGGSIPFPFNLMGG